MVWKQTALVPTLGFLAFVCCSAALVSAGTAPSSATTTSAVSVSPAGPYRSGETVTVSVGPNDLFTHDLRVNILECSDPGGSATGLPKSIADCDGNTLQGGTVIVGSDGSITAKSYTIYSLPNQNLAETADIHPICDTSHPCVLYVGENQEDFTRPKLFSVPFTVTPTPGSIPTVAGSVPTSSAPSGAGTTPPTSAAVTLPGTADSAGTSPSSPAGSSTGTPAGAAVGSLAFTGIGSVLLWLCWIGSLLIAAGSALRLMLRGARS